jgi:hypothetical protein
MRQPVGMLFMLPEVFCTLIWALLCMLISGSWLVRTRSVSRGLCIERQRGNVAVPNNMES